jgi:Aspartyl protease
MSINSFKFKRKNEDSLILVNANVVSEPTTLALDTGATHTVIDLTILLMAGYTMNDVIDIVPMETAKGTIEAYIFNISSFSCLGVSWKDKEVCSYDFLANNVLTTIDGVLGLDFFETCNLNIDFVDSLITVQQK